MLPKDPKHQLDKDVHHIAPSSIETIDRALFTWIREEMDVFCTTNNGWKKVPVLWSTAERAKQSKAARESRDLSGQLRVPRITVERTSIVKDMARNGPYWANVPPSDDSGGVLTIARRINQKKTRNFQNSDAKRKRGQLNFKTQKRNDRVVYEYISIPQPVYIDVTYKITIWTEYQQQMNEIVQPFITEGGGINYDIIRADGHRYEMFIGQDFSQDNNVADMGEEERKYQTTIEIKVLGMLLGDGPNQDHPQVTIRENAVDVKTPREREVFDEKPGDWDKSKFKG